MPGVNRAFSAGHIWVCKILGHSPMLSGECHAVGAKRVQDQETALLYGVHETQAIKTIGAGRLALAAK
jgi:hypothetical protein